jgi:DNA polymerase-3 subunit gamma/tau
MRGNMAARLKQKQESPQSVAESQPRPGSGYLVVARRYRPQTFDELVGQEHVATALKNAIKTGRIGHAYLFTGARGVGKTSTARIFSKALNCVKGPTTEPCNQCDICRSISAGEDIDVLEIDGASNRGIEEIRQLRQNVVVRPSRARFKIYIIDEVHMLTKEAFNALLKTLEEPPEHVKFIFCTTEPNKVPVTILSRCQRFDFAGIESHTIVARLKQILEAENISAEAGVLELLAQRAGGSMRDAQSLLEQLLAFADKEIRLQDVFDLLGMTRSDVLEALAKSAADGNVGRVVEIFHQAITEGADPALLLEQFLTFLRDCMVAEVGSSSQLFLTAQTEDGQRVQQIARKWGLPRLLAAMQILDHTLARMRAVTYDRVLAELALVRISRLGDLLHVHHLVEILKSGQIESLQQIVFGAPTIASGRSQSASPPQTGTVLPRSTGSHPSRSPEGLPDAGFPAQPLANSRQAIESAKQEVALQREKAFGAGSVKTEAMEPGGHVTQLTPDNLAAVWKHVYELVGGMAADHAKAYHNLHLEDGGKLIVTFRKDQKFSCDYCSRPENQEKFNRALRQIVGHPVKLDFVVSEEGGGATSSRPVTAGERSLFDVLQEPMIRKTVEIFGARPVAILPPTKKPVDQPAETPPEMEVGEAADSMEDESDDFED